MTTPIIFALALLLIHDKGRPELNKWFESLQSRNGPCCAHADGYSIADADWESLNGHYRVRVPTFPNSDQSVWLDVPDEAVVKEPNKFGRTMVWPIYTGRDVKIRCFMPGTMI